MPHTATTKQTDTNHRSNTMTDTATTYDLLAAEIDNLPEGTEANIQGDHLEVAVRVGSCCDTQRNGPHWDWVQDGNIVGGFGGQCGGCGSHGVGWAHTGARPVPEGDDPSDFLAELVAAAEALAAGEQADIDRETQSRVDGWLTQAAEVCTAAGYDPTCLTGADLETVAHDLDAEVGNDSEPGVVVDALGDGPGHLVGWDYATAGDGEVIEAVAK